MSFAAPDRNENGAGRRSRLAQSSAVLAAILTFSACNGCAGCPREEPSSSKPSLDLELTQGKVNLRASKISKLELLDQLAERTPFSLTVTDAPAGEITLDARARSVEWLLSELLRGHAYSVRYAAGDGNRLPSAVVVGDEGRTARGPHACRSAGGSSELRLDEPEAVSDVSDTASEGADPAATEETRRFYGDPSTLSEAAPQALPPVGAGCERLSQLLAKDPDPSVRAAAAKQLGGGDGYATTAVLLGALNDPDGHVVKTALSSLADLGDTSVLPVVEEALEDHPDTEVQRALRATVERLQQGARKDPEFPEVIDYARPSGARSAATASQGSAGAASEAEATAVAFH